VTELPKAKRAWISNLVALEDESEDLHGPVNKIQFALVSNIAVAA